MTKTAILYHDADFDGILSNEVCRRFLPGAESFGWDYGRALPNADWASYETIYIVDLSNDELMGREDLRERIVWIDHHGSAIKKWAGTEFKGYRIDGVAACRLCWQWFSQDYANRYGELPIKENYVLRQPKEPRLLRLAGEYDVWDLRDSDALPLQAGLRQLDEAEFLRLIDEEFGVCERERVSRLDHCLDIGRRAQKAKEKADASIVTKYSHDVAFEGLTFLCCNSASFNSQLFAVAVKPHHDALMGWRYDGQQGRCTVSLYHAPGKEHHDLSLIAVKHGGGGHKGACGFQMPLATWAKVLAGERGAEAGA